MNHCESHDCYSENTIYNDLYDFDIEIKNLFSDMNFFQIIYCGITFLAALYAWYSSSSRCDYLIDFKYDETQLEYNRTEWPYSTPLKVPYDLEERMKFWEKCSQQITKVKPNYPFIIRIDGCSFSSFTKQLKKFSDDGVFSEEFRKAMLYTACDLLIKFRPTTCYTHSDEITLVFGNHVDYDDNGNEILTGEHYRNGKVYKLLSEIPSIGSTAFTRNINTQYLTNQDALEYLSRSDLAFDGRLLVFPLESTYEVTNHMIWRTRDCYRNYVSAYAEKHIGKSKLNGVSTEDRVRLLKENGIDLNDETNLRSEQLGMKYGTFLKMYESAKNTHLIQAFYSTKLNFSDELSEFLLYHMKNLMYKNNDNENNDEDVDVDDDRNESDVEKNVKVKTPSIFALDSYEFEDVFNGTFTIKRSKNKNNFVL